MTETTSTRTFVFTDIEGSTRLLRELGATYRDVLEEHDRIITATAQRHGGRSFSSEGDAQDLVFDDPRAAVRAAVEVQRALFAHRWPGEHPVRVRMGIHVGEVSLGPTGFVGMVLHETARIAAAGHGGQVLLSPAAAELVRGQLPEQVRLLDLGEHELKDIDGPRRLYQLAIEGLPREFPALRARPLARVSLPAALTSFIERDEVEAVAGLSEGARLLTLTGPGGTGKTRLAIAVAERIAERFTDGAFFVALDAVREAQLVLPEIATTLGLGAVSAAPLDLLVEHLRERTILLVLDNLEQVVDAGTDLAQLIRACPALTILATSRIPLRVYGEQEFPVPALPLPEPEASDLESLGAVASVRLFEDRARAARPSFALTDDNAADVADIVNRLDGLPLAIELAAARVRMLAPAALRERLDDRLGLLTSGGRDRPDRQQTLRSAIAWSYDLLDEPDRRLFARFGVLAGSATVSHVEAIVGSADELGRDVLEGLESLVDQSLLRSVESDDPELRLAMLATIREYAREQLETSGESDLIHRRHAQVHLALAEEAAPNLLGSDGVGWNDRLERDHDDLRTALDWMVASGEAELALRMIIALWRFWQVRGHLYEADERVHAVLAMPAVADQPPALRARAETAAGGVSYWRSRGLATHRHYQTALELARETDDRALLAEALYNAGFAPEPEEELTGPQTMLVGRVYFEEALAVYRELEDKAGIARTSWSLGILAATRDEVGVARELLTSSLEAARAVGDPYQVGWALHTLGQSDVAVGDLEAAALHIRESLDIWVEAGDMSGVTILLIDAVLVARARGAEACSWRLIGAEERLRLASGAGIGQSAIEFPKLEPRRTPETDEERAWVAEGRELSTAEAVELARATALALD